MSRYQAPTTFAEATTDFRAANSRIRTMVRNGGRTAATSNAIADWRRVADRAMRFILDSGERALAGFLTQEAGLIDNLAQSVTERPDLRRRLNIVRGDLRCRVAHLDGNRSQ